MKSLNTNFYLGRAYNAEHYEFFSRVLQIAGAEFAEEHGITVARQPLSDLHAIENDCYLRNRAMEDTDTIETLDKERDSLFVHASQVITTSVALPIPELAAAAKRLSYVLEPYKGAYALNYESNTSAVRDFLEKMKESQNAADAATLNLTAILTALEAKNDEFYESYLHRSKELLTRNTSETMKSIRPKVDKEAKNFFAAINAIYAVNELITKDAEKKAELEEVIDDINSLLNQLLKNISRRTGSKPTTDADNKPAEDGETPDEGTTPDIPTEPEEDEPVVQ